MYACKSLIGCIEKVGTVINSVVYLRELILVNLIYQIPLATR